MSGHSHHGATGALAAASLAYDLEQAGDLSGAPQSLRRAAAATEVREERGDRLAHAATLACRLGARELAGDLAADAAFESPGIAGRAELAWVADVCGPGDASGTADLGHWAELAQSVGADDIALSLLIRAALQAFWSGADPSVIRRLLGQLSDLHVPSCDAAALSLIAHGSSVDIAAVPLPELNVSDTYDTAFMLGASAFAVGAFAYSTRLLSVAANGFGDAGAILDLLPTLVLRAHGYARLAKWSQAESDADSAIRTAKRAGQPMWLAGAFCAQAIAAAYRGRSQECAARALGAERLALALDIRGVLAMVQLARGIDALSLGCAEAAYRSLRRIHTAGDPAHHETVAAWSIGDVVEAALLVGDHEGAVSLVASCRPIACSPSARSDRARALALIGADDEPERWFERAMFQAAGPEKARASLAFGVWLRRNRRVSESRAHLAAAQEGFSELGMEAWARRACEELTASAARLRRRDAVDPDSLTPQELQVARLAASGLSNRELAHRLRISPGTVSVHLHRVYRKLGISSRRELGAALGKLTRGPSAGHAMRSYPTQWLA